PIPATVVTPTWSSANTAVATIVPTTGALTAIKVDTTRITATADGASGNIKVRVAQVPVGVAKTQGDARSDTVTKAVTVLPRVTIQSGRLSRRPLPIHWATS